MAQYTPYTLEQQIAAFWMRVDKSGGADSCWPWLGIRYSNGYGRFWAGGRNVLAHRFAYETFVGNIPEGMFVCHQCDTPSCVNPNHLWLGTPKANSQDMARKGRSIGQAHPERMARGDQNGSRKNPGHMPHGEHHRDAKLSPESVKEIRDRYQNESVSYQYLASAYSVTRATICDIVKRRSWKHIP